MIKASGDATVVKTIGNHVPDYDNSQRQKDHDLEVRIYERLGSHPRICKYLGATKTDIRLERHPECVRKRLCDLRQLGGEPIFQSALKWSLQTAEGQAYLHSRGVLQADISGGNLLLNKNNDIVLCDFAGSSIDGCHSTVSHGTRFERPYRNWDLPPTIADELFALGSMIYEIWTTTQPYEDEEETVVTQNFREGRFPHVGHLRVGSIILGCWRGSYDMASQVVEDLEQLAQCPGNGVLEESRKSCSDVIFYSSIGLLGTVLLLSLQKQIRKMTT